MDSYDVVVIGFGGAGVCAAIEAADAGCSVLVLDRFYGGGSTALSGGVVYAGGGTRQQRAAGTPDSPEHMLAYLRREIGTTVDDTTLTDFVHGSTAMMSWLEDHGVEFDSTLCPYKTSYPTNRHCLYYSGNELVYRDQAPPAPRGHRTKAANFSGKAFFDALADAARRSGVQLRTLAQATDLVIENDTVVGVRFRAPDAAGRPWHRRLHAAAATMQNWLPPVGQALHSLVARTAPTRRERAVRARRGVVLAGGGFGFNADLIRRHAPLWTGLTPLGTIGDDGSVITLGQRAGGALSHMQKISGWRFLSPPSAFTSGILVDGTGARIGNEQLYGATISERLIEHHAGRGYLVLDHDVWRRARATAYREAAFFHLPQMAYQFSPLGHVRARSIADLARRIGADPAVLAATVDAYNDLGRPDRFGKDADVRQPLSRPPFYAIDCSIGTSPLFPFPFITLGGLKVHEQTGAVLREDGTSIAGLYAAGRSAVGLCSRSYVSGLSLADAVYSGRRAGLAAARATSRSPERS